MLYSVEFFDSETNTVEVLYSGPDKPHAINVYKTTFLQWDTDHKSLTETKCIMMNHENPLWVKTPEIELTGVV